MYSGWVRLDDPLESLPPTAKRLLNAAQRILDRDGFGGLTLQRIADEAEEHKSLIAYHFGGKDGLIEVLADSAWHDDNVALLRHVRKHPPGAEPLVGSLIDAHRRFSFDDLSSRRFYELLPHVVRERSLRQRLARLHEWYLGIGLRYLGANDTTTAHWLPLASLMLAVSQGMAALLCIDPAGVGGDGAFALWRELVGGYVMGRPARAAPGGSRRLAARRQEVIPAPVLSDPAVDMAPVGQKLLAGAQKILQRKGLAAVTLDAVAAAAGESRSAVWYYFGDKRTLVRSLLDMRNYRLQSAYSRRARKMPIGLRAAEALPDFDRAMLEGLSDFTTFFELLPAVLRDEELRTAEIRFQWWLRTLMYSRFVGGNENDDPGADKLATLGVAVPYGLAVQLRVDPKSSIVWEALDLWRHLVSGYFAGDPGVNTEPDAR